LADDGGELEEAKKIKPRAREGRDIIIEKSDGKTVLEGSCRTYGLG